jgi:hypothetical protein
MSVGLLITRTNDRSRNRLVPVSTEEVFRTRWLPGARALNLELVELMQTGFPVGEANRTELVEELTRLRDWMLQHYGADTSELMRLDGLLEELTALVFGGDLEVFVG